MEWWQDLWNQITTFFHDNVWNIIWFFVVLVAGLIIIKIIMMTIKFIFCKREFDPVAAKFILAIIRFSLLLLLVTILLALLGVSVTGITTAFSAAVLAIGMALKDFLSSLASGLILVGSKKYKEGDYIIVGGVEGMVQDINFLFTTLKTPNSTQITLPNTMMVNNAVTNLGAYPIRRVALTFSVAYESDTALVKKVVLDVINSCGLVLKDPAPNCRLKEYSASSIDFFTTCFCDKEDYWDTYYYIMGHVFDEFKKNGISIPFKQIEMRERKDKVIYPIEYEELPERVEKVRKAKKKKVSLEDVEDLTLTGLAASIKDAAANSKKKQKEKKKKDKADKKKDNKNAEQK